LVNTKAAKINLERFCVVSAHIPYIKEEQRERFQGNGDGKNPTAKKGWLWVLVSKAITVFKVALSRSQESAKQMLGEDYQGIVVSDRYSSYNWLDVNQRQVCWAHRANESKF
jgi:hypothetical protein